MPRPKPAAAMEVDDTALIVEDFGYSPAQRGYQDQVGNRAPPIPGDANGDKGEVFYKDATPKADHYVSFRVLLPPSLRKKNSEELPLETTLCFSPNPDEDDYVVVADQSHLKRCEPARAEGAVPGGSATLRPRIGAVLRYRIELGSYRQGDKRFAIRAQLAPTEGLDAALARLGPAHTTPVYVASKVKRSRALAARRAARDDDDDDDDASVSPAPPSTRARHGTRSASRAAAAPRLPQLRDADEAAETRDRVDDLYALVHARVLPALARIENRLEEVLQGQQAPLVDPLMDAPVDAAGLTWSDAVAGMGGGMDEAEEALLLLAPNSQDDDS